ncbi:MAG: chemotaxis protein CheV [Magnetococcales bacterium]|nr:chemotaxis protein CheV [Magnetococcales bacterium]HIJ84984.1 chemotaxis protein CheV [Magnetococcales bacterium]
MGQDQLFKEIDQRTNLAMSNEFEMLTFLLSDGQTYGLNVFKIIEIIETPKYITKVPHSHPNVKGEINFRDRPITLIDIGEYLGMEAIDFANTISYVLVCEYSNTTQGLMVKEPNILITKSWDDIVKPEGEIYDSSCLTAMTWHQDQPIQLLDVEKILNDIIGIETKISDEAIARVKSLATERHHILAVDDSTAACALTRLVLSQMGIAHTVVSSAPKALELLKESLDAKGVSPYTLIFTDIEMPVMDGFTFTRKVKGDPKLNHIYLSVHSSLSNKSNEDKAASAGADDFIPKFTPDNICNLVIRQIEKAERLRKEEIS